MSAFIVGPLAQFWLIPYMETVEGQERFGWLLGEGEARGIALAFMAASALLLIVVLLAFISKPYRRLSAAYESAEPSLPVDSEASRPEASQDETEEVRS